MAKGLVYILYLDASGGVGKPKGNNIRLIAKLMFV
jgi:hypothetical protein